MNSGNVANQTGERHGNENNQNASENVQNELAVFREKWQKEIQNSSQDQCRKILKYSFEDEEKVDFESKAKVLFLKGIEMERVGKVYEAIQFYRRAVQIVPDIEFKIYDITKNREHKSAEGSHDDYAKVNEDLIETADINNSDDDEDDIGDEENCKCDLLSNIQKKCSKRQSICVPEFEQKTTHISSLPMEILLYIFRWVVSSDLDLRSLEMCSLVCRGFYICARDSEIWRLACSRAWGVNCGSLPNKYLSWRQMFLDRARLHFNGCYISKTTYVRPGENSFQDQFYRPWHLVAYYRYLRFFPEGLVLMMTSSEEPAQCVSQLKSRHSRSPSILVGHYRLKDDKVTIVVQRQENKQNVQIYKKSRRNDLCSACSEQTFHMVVLGKCCVVLDTKSMTLQELQIQNHHKRKHVQLIWTGYSVFTRTKKGDENTCTFDLVTNRFPPLWFSRVKSYTSKSDSPLQ